MSSYQISLSKVAQSSLGGIRWCLDFPVTEQRVSIKELNETGVYFQGWLLHAPAAAEIYLKQQGKRQLFPFSSKRPDVVEKILKEKPEHHPQLLCGFSFHAMIESAEFELGLFCQNNEIKLVQGVINGEFKVLFGTEQWMFLDNDTNHSVEQHTGRLLLTKDAKSDWHQYLSKTQDFCHAQGLPHALLIAPSKEAVFPEHYPYAKSPVTPVIQVISMAPSDYPLIYPVEQLQRTPLRSFRLNDTHWSAMGGKIASVLLAEQLGYDKQSLEQLFAEDVYKPRKSMGDLGNKVYPQILTEEFFLTNYAHHKFIRYDNMLPNFGRSIVIQNPTALDDKHCLMFASSSGYTMLEYLSRIFRQITFIHSSGSIDDELCLLLKPDYLVSQTNARFVLRAPMFHYRLQHILKEKLAAMDETAKAELIAKASLRANTANLPAATILQNYLETAG